MATYVTLVHFTDQGRRNVKQTTERAKVLSAGALGNIRTQTMRAYSAVEIDRILNKLP